jgi:magnesium transporter
MLRALYNDHETGWHEVTDFARVSDLLSEDRLIWAEADVDGLSDSNVERISEEFSLHPLAVEDAITSRERAKLDVFKTHLFSIVHELDEVDGRLEAHQIAAFIGSHFLLVIHEGAQRILAKTRERWAAAKSDVKPDPIWLAYALLDTLVDDYQLIAEALENEVENLEDQIFETLELPARRRISDVRTQMQRRLYSLKQRTSRLRRYALPVGRILEETRSPPVRERLDHELLPMIRDVEDHVKRIGDQVRNIDELDSALIELQRSDQATALNEVTKKLTGWAAIIAVPTLISGVYGMNFQLIPTEGGLLGFFFALVLMILTAGSLYVYFKGRGWI